MPSEKIPRAAVSIYESDQVRLESYCSTPDSLDPIIIKISGTKPETPSSRSPQESKAIFFDRNPHEIMLLYGLMQRLADPTESNYAQRPIVIRFADCEQDALERLFYFFDNTKEFIPQNITLNLEGNASIKGTGQQNLAYPETLRFIAKKMSFLLNSLLWAVASDDPVNFAKEDMKDALIKSSQDFATSRSSEHLNIQPFLDTMWKSTNYPGMSLLHKMGTDYCKPLCYATELAHKGKISPALLTDFSIASTDLYSAVLENKNPEQAIDAYQKAFRAIDQKLVQFSGLRAGFTLLVSVVLITVIGTLIVGATGGNFPDLFGVWGAISDYLVGNIAPLKTSESFMGIASGILIVGGIATAAAAPCAGTESWLVRPSQLRFSGGKSSFFYCPTDEALVFKQQFEQVKELAEENISRPNPLPLAKP